MLKIDAEILATIIHAARPSELPSAEWRAGCQSACEYIARHVVIELRDRNVDFDAAQFARACGLDQDVVL